MGVLEGKTAVVTGAGRGIGRELALALAAEGAAVVVNDLGGDWHGEGRDERPAAQVADEIVDAGGRAVADHGDVADATAARTMIERALAEFGRLDIVVNNAGILRDRMIFKMSEDEWDAVIRVHLRGHFCVTAAACAHWRAVAKESGEPAGGRIVCMSSEAGLYGNAGQANYAAAKGGIASFATAVAREMGRYGVTCNAIAPRARTRMTENTFGAFGDGDGGFDRWDPANVAPAIVYLASDVGGRCSGQVLVAGGGVVQVIHPYRPAGELALDRPPTPEEIAGLIDQVRGDDAGPPAFPDLGLSVAGQ
jgi:NAD(P)-dependent dehydrogenase (short-subunit alcohol dehydrogenase family)